MTDAVVWWASVDALGPPPLHLLSAVERERLSAYRREEDRVRSALGAALLRLAVAERTGTPAGQVSVDRSCPDCVRPHGRPRVPGTGLFVSVSHAGDRVGVAVTDVAEVGLDVERIADIDLDAMASSVLTDHERAGTRTARDFYVCWTRKESVLKATGEGLRVPMRRIDVGRPDEAPRVRHSDRPGLRARLIDLRPHDGYVAALALLDDRPLRLEERDGAALAARAG